MKTTQAVAVATAIAAAVSASAQQYRFTTFSGPNSAVETFATGINNSGQICGYYRSSSGTLAFAGFTLFNGSFTSLPAPISGATSAYPAGINNTGQIVGSYSDTANNYIGFLDSNGSFTYLQDPGAASSPVFSEASGINDTGEIVGTYTDSSQTQHGFVYLNGSWQDLSNPAAGSGNHLGTTANGVNSSGEVVGSYEDKSGALHGFLYSIGSFTTLDYPNGYATEAWGINTSGQIVGGYTDIGYVRHGFVYSHGEFTDIDFPGVDVLNVLGINDNGQLVGVYSSPGVEFGAFLATPTPPLRFVPASPCRAADTRVAGGPVSAGSSRDFTIPGALCGVPSSAAALSLNVTAVPTGPLGYLTVWPLGWPRPLASTLNSLDGRIKADAAIVPVGNGGAISVYATDKTDVILDIDGYFVPATDASALAFNPLTPCRIADTRDATGSFGAPMLPGEQSRTFPVLSSTCNVPASAQAYSLNFTAVPKVKLDYLTVWPTGQQQPVVSTLNALTGAITANAAIVPAGSSGSVDVFSTDATDLIIDINGYFAPADTGGLSLYNVTPCRALDTRNPAGSPPIGAKRDVNVTSSTCGVPSSAKAYVFNATVVPPAPLGYLSLWPQGEQQPVVSTLNAFDGAITSNMAIVPTTNGSISAYPSSATHLILDIAGYFAP